jgi:hypothetical protein
MGRLKEPFKERKEGRLLGAKTTEIKIPEGAYNQFCCLGRKRMAKTLGVARSKFVRRARASVTGAASV